MNKVNLRNFGMAGTHISKFASDLVTIFTCINKLNSLITKAKMGHAEADRLFSTMMHSLPIITKDADKKLIEGVRKPIVAAIVASGQINAIAAKFNDTEVTVTYESTAESIQDYYAQETKRAREAYQNSAEGKAAAKRNEDEREELSKLAATLISQLPKLNFGDNAAVLDWLCKLQPASDRVGVNVKGKEIVKIFSEKGFEVDANTNEKFNGEDEDNFARYIIGQALSMLETHGTIHHMLISFTDDWKAKFKKETV